MEILEFINKFIKILASDNILHLSWIAYLILSLTFLAPFYISTLFNIFLEKSVGFCRLLEIIVANYNCKVKVITL